MFKFYLFTVFTALISYIVFRMRLNCYEEKISSELHLKEPIYEDEYLLTLQVFLTIIIPILNILTTFVCAFGALVDIDTLIKIYKSTGKFE